MVLFVFVWLSFPLLGHHHPLFYCYNKNEHFNPLFYSSVFLEDHIKLCLPHYLNDNTCFVWMISYLLIPSEPWILKALNLGHLLLLWIMWRPHWHVLPVAFFLFFSVYQTIFNSTIPVILFSYFLGKIVLKQLFQENNALCCYVAV